MSETEPRQPEQAQAPVPPSVERIRQPLFSTVRRGYDPDQVLRFLGQVADHVEALEARARDLEAEVQRARRERDEARAGQAAAGPEAFAGAAARVAELIRAFEQDVERLRRQAEDDAEGILAQARAEAEEIRRESHRQAKELRRLAEQTLADARAEAHRSISGLASRREAYAGQLREMRDRLLTAAAELDEALHAEGGDRLVVLEETTEAQPPEEAGGGHRASVPPEEAGGRHRASVPPEELKAWLSALEAEAESGG